MIRIGRNLQVAIGFPASTILLPLAVSMGAGIGEVSGKIQFDPYVLEPGAFVLTPLLSILQVSLGLLALVTKISPGISDSEILFPAAEKAVGHRTLRAGGLGYADPEIPTLTFRGNYETFMQYGELHIS